MHVARAGQAPPPCSRRTTPILPHLPPFPGAWGSGRRLAADLDLAGALGVPSDFRESREALHIFAAGSYAGALQSLALGPFEHVKVRACARGFGVCGGGVGWGAGGDGRLRHVRYLREVAVERARRQSMLLPAPTPPPPPPRPLAQIQQQVFGSPRAGGQQHLSSQQRQQQQHLSLSACTRRMLQLGGPALLARGTAATLLRDAPVYGAYFLSYEWLKHYLADTAAAGGGGGGGAGAGAARGSSASGGGGGGGGVSGGGAPVGGESSTASGSSWERGGAGGVAGRTGGSNSSNISGGVGVGVGAGIGLPRASREPSWGDGVLTATGRPPVPVWAMLVAGAAAGVFSWALALPVDVIKSQIQSAPLETPRAETRIGAVTARLYAAGGLPIFFRGLVPCLARAAPVNAVTFLGYEWATNVLLGATGEEGG